MKYPKNLKDVKIEGKCYVRFVVDKEGKVKNMKVLKGINKKLDREAKRVIASLPVFIPEMQQGKPVSTALVVPLVFKVNQEK